MHLVGDLVGVDEPPSFLFIRRHCHINVCPIAAIFLAILNFCSQSDARPSDALTHPYAHARALVCEMEGARIPATQPRE